jgi:hypothetical protein
MHGFGESVKREIGCHLPGPARPKPKRFGFLGSEEIGFCRVLLLPYYRHLASVAPCVTADGA